MEVVIKRDYDQMSKAAAQLVVDVLNTKPNAVLGMATGSTPLGLYQELVRLHQAGEVDFSRVTTFNLDKYVGLPANHPQSYHYFMDEHFFRHVNIPRHNINIPSGTTSNYPAFCQWYEGRIAECGGIDLQILGIGSDGHIAFNEPGSSLSSRTRLKTLSKQTIDDNARFFDAREDVPVYAITMGVGTILDARRLVLVASGKTKAKAIAQAVEGPVTSMVTASAMQLHRDATVIVDDAAAAGLTMREYYEFIYAAKPAAPRALVSDRPIIRVQHVVKSFGSVMAVNDVSFDVRPGEIFAFLGPNGAGKTTTIKMLTTLLHPTAGALELDGLDVTTHRTEVRKRFGVVFQDPSLDSELTAWVNMDIHGVLYHVPRHARRERCELLLRMFELWERRDDLVKTFSGGMKRRLEIARGLLHTPKVLFLDEPTLGLDPQSRNQMWTHVRNLRAAEGVTVFLTTHYMDEADRVADRIAVIDHGRLVATGSSAELNTQTGTDSLEAAFLALTGTTIRDESATAADQMRQVARVWRR